MTMTDAIELGRAAARQWLADDAPHTPFPNIEEDAEKRDARARMISNLRSWIGYYRGGVPELAGAGPQEVLARMLSSYVDINLRPDGEERFASVAELVDDDCFQWWLAFSAFRAPTDIRLEEEIYQLQDQFSVGFVRELLGG